MNNLQNILFSGTGLASYNVSIPMSNYCNCFVKDKMKCILMKFTDDINTMLCPIIVNSNTIKLTVHTSCYWDLDLLCVI